MQDTLQAITDFADRAHGDQKRRYTPDRYIVHPIRVMELCRAYTKDLAVLSAALLHDVLEDTAVNKEALLDFLLQVMDEKKAKRTLALVVELTDVYIKANYPAWNRRKRRAKEAERLARSSKESQTVKYADILDNIRELPEGDDFSIVFLRECKNLLKSINKGEPQLYQLAVEEVERRLKELSR
jgi:(p)ppGpp synthase/HD superfamily hydrolase